MSADHMGKTRGGTLWEPQFITNLDQDNCMGCGRCYKVCPRSVFDLDEKEDDESGFGYDDVMMVMVLSDADDCIGCGSCSRVCPKNCHTLTAASAL